MAETLVLADAEIRDITHRRQPAAQARALDRLQVPYSRRLDGTLLVGRDAMKRALGGPTKKEPGGDAANGLNWNKKA
jgi:hypothetical protein